MGKLDDLMKQMNKDMKGEIVHWGQSSYDYERIPFTSPRLNYMTFGGLPMNRLIEFFGEEHGGKTTTALDIVANYQHMENAKSVMWIDAENSLDTVWATKLGVKVDDLLIISPENQSAETLFETILKFMDTGEIGLVVIDSLGVMVSSQAMGKSIEEQTRGGIAKALTAFSNKAEMSAKKHKCTVLGINQLRDKMDSMYGGTTTTGGRGWRHNTSVRLDFRRGKFIDSKYAEISQNAENPIGNKVMVSMPKNKTCPPTRHTGFYTLRYDIGVDYLYDLTDLCINYGIVDKSGAWYELVNPETGEQVAKLQGMAKLYTYLEENTEVLQQVEQWVNERMKEN